MKQSVSQMALQSEDKVIAKTNERQRKKKNIECLAWRRSLSLRDSKIDILFKEKYFNQ